MKSISAKVAILYIFLAVLNIAFFVMIIFENQIDLITANIEYQTKEIANNIYSKLAITLEQINRNPAEFDSETKIIEEINTNLKNIITNYLIFREDKSILYQSDNSIIIDDNHLLAALQAFKNKEFMKEFYYSKINEKTHEIYFYIPISILHGEDAILLFKLEMKDINKRITTLYSLVLLVIGFIAIFHIVFGFILHKLIISPIKILSRKSIQISNGDLSARVKLKKKDEIGQLGNAFNNMADSIQEKIDQLTEQNKRMLLELKMARKVQNSIYPVIRENEKFRLAIYHKPMAEVSGDYHDVFSLGNGIFGCLMADVSGHGVSAALITMLIKELFARTAYEYTDTKLFFRYINNELGDLIDTFDKFFTAFYLIIDTDSRMTFSNAGHPKAYLFRPTSDKIYELDTNGVFIGFSKQLSGQFDSKRCQLKSKDKVFLFTDGIMDARNKDNDEYGLKRLCSIAKKFSHLPCDKMMELILSDLNAFRGDVEQKDDETIMIVEMK